MKKENTYFLTAALVAIILILVFLVIYKSNQLEKANIENDLKNIMSQQQPKKQVWYRKTEMGFKPEQKS